MLKFLANRWFLIVLVVVLAAGMAAGERLKWLADHKSLRDWVVAVSLFLMALPLEPRVIWRTIRRPLAPGIAIFVSVVLVPLAAWCVVWLLGPQLAALGVSWALAPDLRTSLLVASTTPCTMASAAVWTRRAGGNDAVATLVTVATNAACFLVMPVSLQILVGRAVESDELNFLNAVWQLGKLVVLPMVAAQLCRLWKPVAEFSLRRKAPLGILTQCGILYMVLLGAIQTGVQLFGDHEHGFGVSDLLLMLAAVNAVHLSTFWAGWRLAGGLGVSREDQIAVGFAGSQKTLMIGLKVCLDLQVSILPMVAFHVTQLLVDTLIADRMARRRDAAGLDPPGRSA